MPRQQSSHAPESQPPHEASQQTSSHWWAQHGMQALRMIVGRGALRDVAT
jgi:hypothetical protein